MMKIGYFPIRFALVAFLTSASLAAEAFPAPLHEPTAVATLRSIGIMWPFEGDIKGRATCTVRYRKAKEATWRAALALHRKPPVKVNVKKSTAGKRRVTFLGGLDKWNQHTRDYAINHWRANYLAGSIFNLEPDTEYEIELTLRDGAGRAPLTRTLIVSTRPYPILYPGGKVLEVTADGGIEGLRDALKKARAGDTILLHGGKYAGPLAVHASGAPGRPIVIRAAGDGEAVITGRGYRKGGSVLEITGSHLHLHGISVKEGINGIKIGEGRRYNHPNWDFYRGREDIPKDITITRCSVSEVQHAIIGTANDCYVADNILTGLAAKVDGIDWSEGEGVEITGSGTVVCHNRMRSLADGVSVYNNTNNQDVHNNDVSGLSDDGIELDYSDYNNRIWNNKFNFAGNNGISFQPHIGGPVYVFRNQVIGFREGCIKDRYASADIYLFHNTFVGHGKMTHGEREIQNAPTDLPKGLYSRNNLYLMADGTGTPVVDFRDSELALGGLDIDFEGMSGHMMIGWSNKGKEVPASRYPGSRYQSGVGLLVPIESFQKVSGVLANVVFTDPAKIFEVPLPPYRDWKETGPEPVMRLAAGSSPIDAGVAIPSVNDDFEGAAPDLGALEFGRAEPIYGPRPAGRAPYEARKTAE